MVTVSSEAVRRTADAKKPHSLAWIETAPPRKAASPGALVPAAESQGPATSKSAHGAPAAAATIRKTSPVRPTKRLPQRLAEKTSAKRLAATATVRRKKGAISVIPM